MYDIASVIQNLSTRWMKAWIDLDYAVLEEVMAADFALVVSAMPATLMPRAAWLATCQRYRCTSFHYSGVQVRQLDENMAVMSAIAEQQAELDGVDRSGQFWLTDVWRRNGEGQWHVCARYSSFPESKGQSASALERLSESPT